MDGPDGLGECDGFGYQTAQVRNIAAVTTAVARGDLCPQDHRRCEGRDSGIEGNKVIRWWIS